uniref:Polymer-forming cytoskeletal protein n=1 Tax=Dictyoglomus thermophilum TaxID=14 RepID=A0A7C3MKN0_DICTH
MLGRKEKPEVMDTVIGGQSEFEGKLVSKASLRIDGRFKGDIEAKEAVIVGKTGFVDGNIKANKVIIIGEVVGNIICRGSLEILSTGKFKGDLKLGGKISVEEGGVLLGKTEILEEDKISEFFDINLSS